jgi:hypothetical protein
VAGQWRLSGLAFAGVFVLGALHVVRCRVAALNGDGGPMDFDKHVERTANRPVTLGGRRRFDKRSAAGALLVRAPRSR